MRIAVFGLLAGVTLSVLRAPVGLDLFQIPAPSAGAAYAVRALPFLLIAAALAGRARSRAPRDVGWMLCAATAGFFLHGLLAADRLAPSSWLWIAMAAAALLAALVWTARWSARPAIEELSVEGDDPGWGELAGLAIAGGGTAIAFDALARYARLLGGGTPGDDAVLAVVVLAIASVGALSFGWISASRRLRGLAQPAGLALASAGALVGLRVVGNIGSPRGLDRYFRHPLLRLTGVETSQHGTASFDALIASSCFVVPALLLGTALCGAERRSRLASALAGAAAGTWLVPSLLGDGRTSSDLAPIGAAFAATGALVALLARRGLGRRRWAAMAVAGGAGILPFAIEVAPSPPVEPWSRAPVLPRLVFETPEGTIAIAGSRGGIDTVTLDRIGLTPSVDDAVADARRLEVSMDLAPETLRARRAARVLLVGQLTPGRALKLADLGASSIDRTASWWQSMGRIEAELFSGRSLPDGKPLSPAEARRRLADGGYDVVIVPCVAGPPPCAPARACIEPRVDPAQRAVQIVWLDIGSPIAHLDLGPEVVLAADGLDDVAVGVVCGGVPAEAYRGRHLFLATGEPLTAPAPLHWLLLRAEERANAGRAWAAERLAHGSSTGEDALITQGLQAYFESQKRSSPYENPADRVELPTEALARLRDAALDRPLDSFTRGMWEGIAGLLVGKRWIPEIYEYLGPLERRHAPWPALQRALAHAALESLAPEEALEALDGLVDREPDRAENWIYLGEAQSQTGRPAEAARSFRRALAIEGDAPEVRRALAMELVRAGDPDGHALVEEILADDPEDEVLRAFLGPGPPPPVEPGFRPHLFSSGHLH